jgi:TatD DNase family protein
MVGDVVDAAVAAGVGRILAVATDRPTGGACARLAALFPSVYAAVGIHPHEAERFDATSLAELRRLAASPKVVAIGEIGLDYYRDLAPRDAQRRAFTAQLELAAELDLPVVVHNRDADGDVLREIGSVARGPELCGRAGVLHCFSGDRPMADEARAAGFFVSFAGNVTFRRAAALRDVAGSLPLEWILTETDSPYLAPEPRRGRINTPAGVGLEWILTETDSPYLAPEPRRGRINTPAAVGRVAETLAAARDLPVSAVAAQTYANAVQIFRWN